MLGDSTARAAIKTPDIHPVRLKINGDIARIISTFISVIYNQDMEVLFKNFKLILIIMLYGLSLIFTKKVGKKLERLNRTDLLSLWLVEIGSDIRLYGSLSLSLVALGLIVETYIKGSSRYVFILMELVLSVWIFLIFIAFIETSEKYFKYRILQLNLLEIDKRNYSTLIPVAASILKVLAYATIVLSFLHILGVDIRPILNVGAIGLAALMYAGSETIKDILATLKFFLTRKLYVGSYVKINNFKPGIVVRITIIDTWIESNLDSGGRIIQIVNNGSIQTVVYLDPPLISENQEIIRGE